MAFSPIMKNFRWTEADPFKDNLKVFPQNELLELRKQLVDLTNAGIIEDKQSVPTPPPGTKINKMVKFCMDFSWYNKRTIPDLFTDQKIEVVLNRLAGNKWFSVLGMVSELSQVPMYPGERQSPYAIQPLGFYETERMQPGYSDMLATFQKLMQYILKDMNMVDILVFLDYIIVFGTTLEEHEARLVKIFDRLKTNGYKVSLEKSSFCVSNFTYLGHLIWGDGIMIAPEKVNAISTWPEPKTASELKSFLEFCGYYQHFYKDFDTLSSPLNQLLLDMAKKKLEDEKVTPKLPWWTRESIEERWTKECRKAFRSLKGCILSAPVLDRVKMSPRHPYHYR